MSRRDGRYRTAVGLGLVATIAAIAVWIVGSMVPLESLTPTKGEDASNYDTGYRTRRGTCEPIRLRGLPPGAAADDKRADCSRQEEDHRLSQQAVHQAARSAEAAEEGLQLGREQTRVAFVQAILSALAVVFTGWAAWAAARAALAAADGVDASQRSAKAAEDAVAKSEAILAHTQEATERQLRAYVHIAESSFIDDARGQRVVLKFKNFGLTPAYDVWIERAASVRDFPLTEPLAKLMRVGAKFDVGPNSDGGTLVFPFPEWDDAPVQRFGRGGTALYVHGAIHYRDAFKVRHRTKFRHYLRSRTDSGISPDDGGNEST